MSAEPTWQLALLAAAVFAVNPHRLGGIDVKAFSRTRQRITWLAELSGLLDQERLRRVPINVSEARLLGGLNFTATAQAGKPILEQGLLSECHQQVLVMPMAERAERRVVAHICQALDNRSIRLQRDGFSKELPAELSVIALNEGIDDEQLEASLGERLAFQIQLFELAPSCLSPSTFDRADIIGAQQRLADVTVPRDTAHTAGGRVRRPRSGFKSSHSVCLRYAAGTGCLAQARCRG